MVASILSALGLVLIIIIAAIALVIGLVLRAFPPPEVLTVRARALAVERRSCRKLVAVLAMVASILAAGPNPSSAAGSSHPVIFLHGYEADSGADCPTVWGDMKQWLREKGWTGDLVTVGYYVDDTRCDASINQDGNHAVHFASGHIGSAHSTATNIRHLGYHLAWWLYDRYVSRGQCVDAVAHSMGGLILRYAIAQVENGNADFPPSICVEDAVTLGTPHAGTPWAWGCLTLQCKQMRGNLRCDGATASPFIQWLRANAKDPDGAGRTQWTLLGSQADQDVPAACAVRNMAAFGKTRYLLTSWIRHAEYMHLTSPYDTADAQYKKVSSDWVTDFDVPWPVRWSVLALEQSSW
jgi:hypothetical protein